MLPHSYILVLIKHLLSIYVYITALNSREGRETVKDTDCTLK